MSKNYFFCENFKLLKKIRTFFLKMKNCSNKLLAENGMLKSDENFSKYSAFGATFIRKKHGVFSLKNY